MKGYTKKQEILNVIYKCLKEYDENLKNKKLMFILENKDRTISKEEVFLPKSSYYHLTGTNIYNKDGKN